MSACMYVCVCHVHLDQCPPLVVLPRAETQTSAPQSWSRRLACYADALLPPPFSGSPHVWRPPPLASAPTPLLSLSQSEPDAPVRARGEGAYFLYLPTPNPPTPHPSPHSPIFHHPTPHILTLTTSPSHHSLFPFLTLPLSPLIPHHDTPHPPTLSPSLQTCL